jgi:hypothetical protein
MSATGSAQISSSFIVARKPLMLGRDLAGAVLKLPRRIGENGAELLPPRRSEQVDRGFGEG